MVALGVLAITFNTAGKALLTDEKYRVSLFATLKVVLTTVIDYKLKVFNYSNLTIFSPRHPLNTVWVEAAV